MRDYELGGLVKTRFLDYDSYIYWPFLRKQILYHADQDSSNQAWCNTQKGKYKPRVTLKRKKKYLFWDIGIRPYAPP